MSVRRNVGRMAAMNKRQRKKAYCQKYGYNSNEEDRVQQMIRDMVEYADQRPAEVKKECARVAYSSFLENIKQRNQSKRKWWRKTK